METYGIWSLLPPVLAIVLAIRTKKVYPSLILGIWLGWFIMGADVYDTAADWWQYPLLFLRQLWESLLTTLQALVDVFADAGNTRTIIFSALVGALILFIQVSGGVRGFVRWLSQKLDAYEEKNAGRSRLLIQFFAWLTGLLIFVESSISVLTVGALYRPIFDKMRISREKLAYLADSSSAPSSILIPFNGWGAFIMGLLAAQEFDHPFATMIASIPYNFYPFLALALALVVVWRSWHIGPMAQAEHRVQATGAVMREGAQPMVSEELTDAPPKEHVPHRPLNMILPIAMMVLMMPVMLTYTGWEAVQETYPDAGWGQKVQYAIGQGSGSTSVLVAVVVSLLFAMVLYRVQGIMKGLEMVDLTIKGIQGMLPLALLMVLAFAIGAVCKELGTGVYVAEVTREWLSPNLVPLVIFLTSCFIAFSTGTSWGTFAIMLAIAIPMARTLDANVLMTIAAALGGGVFGDHCSPISDTTILSSMASSTDHIDHVRTQLPYALLAGGAAALMYLLMGMLA